MPGYSKYHVGHISLQAPTEGDPGEMIWFRNIMIKKL
jgi:hypothetical protein